VVKISVVGHDLVSASRDMATADHLVNSTH